MARKRLRMEGKEAKKNPTLLTWGVVGLAWLGLSSVHTGRCRNGFGNLAAVRIYPNGRTGGRQTVAS
tara:strand:- start:469 stop:669 length:201 start_codon:yes stop_codon:yes gene_type:complete